MWISRITGTFLLAGAFWCILPSCSKKGDFIDEGQTGTGHFFYPVIVNDNLFDTLTHKVLNLTDTTFSPGQELIIELDFFSRDPVDSLELWAGKSTAKLTKSVALSGQDAGFSATKGIDTVLFTYTLPAGLDSLSKWYIRPGLVTSHQLHSFIQAEIMIR